MSDSRKKRKNNKNSKVLKWQISLLGLSAIAFLMVSSSALAISNLKSPSIQRIKIFHQTTLNTNLPDLPVKTTDSVAPVLTAESVLAIDEDSGVTIYSKNSDQELLPASTTKIVTALVALDYYKLDDVLTIGNVAVDGQKMGLVQGEQIKVGDLLYGLLVYSANDAAMALSQSYPGGFSAFIDAMNSKAVALHLINSHFVNPVGLDGVGQYTTARDLILASEVAMRNPVFASIVGTKGIIVKSVDGKYSHRLVNINQLLGTVPGVLGVKTGWTENARENLVTYIDRDDHKIMIALLGSEDRFGETKALIDWIFANFEWRKVDNPPVN